MPKPTRFRPIVGEPLERRLALSTTGGSVVIPGLDTSAATTPTERLDSASMSAHASFVSLANAGKASGVVFFGDSIFARWDEPGYPGLPVWNGELTPMGAVDFGIDGDRTQNLLWRLQNGELDGKPQVAVVMIGTNNLVYTGANESPQETAQGIDAVVATIRALSPDTKVLLLGILPRGQTSGDPVRAEIDQVNSLIAPLADGRNVFYLNLGSLLVGPDGTIPGEVLQPPDYLHPTISGYQVMADALQAPLDGLLGRPVPSPYQYGGPILVNLPPNQVLTATSPGGAPLEFTMPRAVDALDPNPLVVSSAAPGTILPVGTTSIPIEATDRYGHIAIGSFTVTVKPGGATLSNLPSNIVVEATSGNGAVVNYQAPTVNAPGDPAAQVVESPPSGTMFPIGTTLVQATVPGSADRTSRARSP